MWDFVVAMVGTGTNLKNQGQLSGSSHVVYTSLVDRLTEVMNVSDVEAFIANPSDSLRQQLLVRDMAALEPHLAQPIIQQAEALQKALEATHGDVLEGLSLHFDGATMHNLRIQDNEVEDGGMRISANDTTIDGDVEIIRNTVGSASKSAPKRI